MKIWESTRTSNSQSGSSLGSARVHSLTLSFTLRLLLLACNLASPSLGRKPKARVATHMNSLRNPKNVFKMKQRKMKRIRAHSIVRNFFRVGECVGAPRWD